MGAVGKSCVERETRARISARTHEGKVEQALLQVAPVVRGVGLGWRGRVGSRRKVHRVHRQHLRATVAAPVAAADSAAAPAASSATPAADGFASAATAATAATARKLPRVCLVVVHLGPNKPDDSTARRELLGWMVGLALQ